MEHYSDATRIIREALSKALFSQTQFKLYQSEIMSNYSRIEEQFQQHHNSWRRYFSIKRLGLALIFILILLVVVSTASGIILFGDFSSLVTGNVPLLNSPRLLAQSNCFMDPAAYSGQVSIMDDVQIDQFINQQCSDYPPAQSCPIPNLVHIVYLGGPFKLYHYIGLKSIMENIKPFALYMHVNSELPWDSEFFKRAMKEFNFNIVHARTVSKVQNQTVGGYAHQADVIRLESIIMYGGIYLDTDVLAFKSFDALLEKHSLVMGPENDYGLNNGIILAKRCSKFLRNWYKQYNTFDDADWAGHSVYLPKKLYDIDPMDMTIEPEIRTNYFGDTYFDNPAHGESFKTAYAKHAFLRGKYQAELNLTALEHDDSDFGKVLWAVYNNLPVP